VKKIEWKIIRFPEIGKSLLRKVRGEKTRENPSKFGDEERS